MCTNANTSDDTLRAAIVGAGRVAERHARSIDDDPRAAVTAVCDTDHENAAAVADPRDAAVYTDYGALFETKEVDVCYLLTPPFVRAGPAVAAAEHGIDLFVEKPAAVRLDEAHEVLRAVEANGIVTHSGYDLRYARTVEAAHELVGDRTLGLVDARQWAGLPPEGWKWKRETATSYPVHIATHAYDIVRSFAGEVERVAAVGDHQIAPDDLEYEDAGSASLHHRDGTVGHVSHVAFRHAGNTLDLLGEGFHLHVHRNDNVLTGEVDGEPVEVRGADTFHDRERWGKMTRTFLDAVETRDTSAIRSDYADATRTLELTVAATEAMRGDGVVDLSSRR
ncbi:Gfo/Idh/MocA family protein [Halomarina oriensis]|uniref:Gfo/Idh/MocA family oxidoreductase n=1 Tax=Halomarina oriensis TaxID=671145 RepID=A0A6B0GN05_9EURY|nr:Gfo/Idh/MocA family oxidoreductase [Halomarina oriensis]MWG35007.1 gfo/Idh/MocA family oxidoreductase [Halomarina oriensis]